MEKMKLRLHGAQRFINILVENTGLSVGTTGFLKMVVATGIAILETMMMMVKMS